MRPTSDRLREAVFNILAHGYDDPLSDARVIDLFAGTGALGIEALSRGASFAVFVDDGSEARALLRQNLDAFGLGGSSGLFRRDATRMGDSAPNAPFDLVFCDPPYGQALTGPALLSLHRGGWLVPGALLVLEERAGELAEVPGGYEILDRRRYAGTEVTFARYAPEPLTIR